MKKIVLFLILVTSTGASLQAQDTVWKKPGPLSNYFYNNWLDTATRYATAWSGVLADVIAKRFIAKDTLQVYGIAAMMTHPNHFFFYPSARFPTFQDYLDSTYPENPTLDNCEEKLLLYQYHGSGPTAMQLMGDSLSVQYYGVSYWMMSNTAPISYFDTFPKPVYERYYSEPQTVYDTFYAGYTQRHFVLEQYIDVWGDTSIHPHVFRPGFQCFDFTRANTNTIGYEEGEAWLRRNDPYSPATWRYRPDDSLFSLFIFPILTPPDTTPHPDTTVNPNDTLVPADTLTTGYLVLHSGNTVVIAPGDTLVISGDTLVNTGDTLVVTLGDTVVIGGSTLVLDVGDTIFVNPGDTLFVGPDGSIHVNPGGTIVVGSGRGDPGAGLRQTDMVSRYTSVAPNPATERATVLSSFGLERIEVYDSQGRQTLTLPATGYKAVLDTHAWPSGTYLLRITTPLGTTTKKLLVQ